MMKKYFSVIMLAAMLAGCGKDGKVVITGAFDNDREGTVYLEQSDVNRLTVVDSAVIKRGHFRFVQEIVNPEFYQIGTGKNDFVSILAMPGEKIGLTFGKSPLVTGYTVTGSVESEKIKELDNRLYRTKVSLDSLRTIYSTLSEPNITLRGPSLEEEYLNVVNSQRKYTIGFILDNITSLTAIKALYQRIDDNTYVLYQPRDLQFLKIVSDSLSVKYPTSKHVRALTDNFNNELNKMYLDRLASMASNTPAEKLDPDLLNNDGKRISLSSLKGKYVLLSFWVTTSEECLNDLSVLKSIYKQYHSKGLEIYHISLDTDEARWKEVVKFEEIPWISVREDDPANPFIANSLNISQLPSNLLYDREGNIINSNLYGRNLQIKMDQLFNK